jgi:predicted transcriptional regulator
MRSLPLAPKPLTTLHCFDPSYRVPVYLDQPLWGEGRGRGLTTNMMSLCLQLDAAIVTSYLQDEQGGGRERRVTFQQKLPARVASLLDQMAEQLADSDLDLECYLRESGLGLLFPRVELCLQEPDQDLVRVDTGLVDCELLHHQPTVVPQS